MTRPTCECNGLCIAHAARGKSLRDSPRAAAEEEGREEKRRKMRKAGGEEHEAAKDDEAKSEPNPSAARCLLRAHIRLGNSIGMSRNGSGHGTLWFPRLLAIKTRWGGA